MCERDVILSADKTERERYNVELHEEIAEFGGGPRCEERLEDAAQPPQQKPRAGRGKLFPHHFLLK